MERICAVHARGTILARVTGALVYVDRALPCSSGEAGLYRGRYAAPRIVVRDTVDVGAQPTAVACHARTPICANRNAKTDCLGIDTVCPVAAGAAQALVDVDIAVVPVEARNACARIHVDPFSARRTILTWTRAALINIVSAVHAFVTSGARARIGIHAIDAHT